jgi:hypothetical protein
MQTTGAGTRRRMHWVARLRPLLLASVVVSCGSVPAAEPTLRAEVAQVPEPWTQVLAALDEADAVYHLIADTPIKELEARSEEIGERVTRARDAWRRAKSYDLTKVRFRCTIWAYLGPEGESREAISVPLPGHRVAFEADLSGGMMNGGYLMRPTIMSSRGKPVARLYCRRDLLNGNDFSQQPKSDDLDVSALAFGPILSTDDVSIPDLIVNIKR